MTPGRVREPAVAGRFYAGRAHRLAAEVDDHLATARAGLARAETAPAAEGRQVAIVAPHAGHIYSGPTAGFAYAAVDPGPVRRVVLLGPAHYLPVDGVGVSTASAWRTPLGDVPLDLELTAELMEDFDCVTPADDAHAPEHSLEVQLPFLQRTLGDGWRLVPLIVGSDVTEELADLIEHCAGLPGTLIVVSTDLSHYLDHESAVARDSRTIRAVLARSSHEIGPYDACGCYPLRGLLAAAARRDWNLRLLDARNSGDTAGDRGRVVGYGSFLVSEPSSRDRAATLSGDARARLLALARGTIETALAHGMRRPALDDRDWTPEMRRTGAAFVSLHTSSGDLLGCIGSLTASRALAADVATHAFDAAFRDRRFNPLTAAQAADMVVSISVLSPPRPFACRAYEDLVERVPVGSGVVATDGWRGATFLPVMWRQMPDKRVFLSQLWRKAGLEPGEWSSKTRIEVYASEEFAEERVQGS